MSIGPIKAASIGLTTTMLATLLVFNLNNLPLIGAGPTYRADFMDAAGLQVGEEVRIAGIKVGDVSRVALKGDKVVISFHVKGQRLGRDTRASIEIKTLLGQHFLTVEPNGPGTLPADSEIPLERTTTPVQIVPTVQQLTSTVNAIDTQRLGAAFDALSAALHDTAPEVRRTLDGLTSLSRVVARRDSAIQELFAQARQVSGVVASRDAQISDLIGASNQVLHVLDQRHDDIHDLLVGTRDLAAQLTDVIQDNRHQLRPALERLNEVTQVLQRNDDNLNSILSQLPIYLRLLTTVGGSGPWFDANVEVQRAFAVCDSGSAGQLAALMDPILSQANLAINHSPAPCLPLGPATNATPTAGGPR